MNRLNLLFVLMFPAILFSQEIIQTCSPVASLIPGTDRNNFNSSELSDGYLNNFEVPAPSACPCGVPTLTNMIIEVNLNSINIPNPLPSECDFFAVFANVYLNENPLNLNAPGTYPVDFEIFEGDCFPSGQGTTMTGTFSLDVVGTCGASVNPGDIIGIDIIPAINWGNTNVDPACANINGNGVNGAYISLSYSICIDYIYQCPIPPVADAGPPSVSINCGDSQLIGAMPVSPTEGLDYEWSNGASGTLEWGGNPNDDDYGQINVMPSSTTTYILTVTDNASGCQGTDTIEVIVLDPSVDNVTANHPVTCGVDDGSIVITATGTNLEYSIDGGNTWQDSNTFTGLAAGDYNVVVRNKDFNGCLCMY